MDNQLFSLKDAADILHVQAYRITYLLSTGQVPEPQRVGGKRLFTIFDLHRIAEKLGLEDVEKLMARQARSHNV